MSRPNKRRIAPYRPHLHGATRGGKRPGAIRVQLAPSVGGVAPWRPAVRAERVEVGAARRLPGVVLVDARGADNGQPAQHLARGGAERDHREAAYDTRLGARGNFVDKI